MGYVTCGMHGRRGPRCCWGCDRCPKCSPETGRLGRGDYCKRCAAEAKAKGLVWSSYHGNYVTPDDLVRALAWEAERKLAEYRERTVTEEV